MLVHTPYCLLRAADWVALGRCRPRALTDRCALALKHIIPQIMGSLYVCKQTTQQPAIISNQQGRTTG
jgi:hypothetical protein